MRLCLNVTRLCFTVKNDRASLAYFSGPRAIRYPDAPTVPNRRRVSKNMAILLRATGAALSARQGWPGQDQRAARVWRRSRVCPTTVSPDYPDSVLLGLGNRLGEGDAGRLEAESVREHGHSPFALPVDRA